MKCEESLFHPHGYSIDDHSLLFISHKKVDQVSEVHQECYCKVYRTCVRGNKIVQCTRSVSEIIFTRDTYTCENLSRATSVSPVAAIPQVNYLAGMLLVWKQ
jgi:hypothetical protein